MKSSLERSLLSVLAIPPFSFFYSIPPTSKTRDRPLQILALGLSRCGTESLKFALEELGYQRVYHGFETTGTDAVTWCRLFDRKYKQGQQINLEQFDSVIGDCEAVTDAPCYLFAGDLIRAYPDVKVSNVVASSLRRYFLAIEMIYLAQEVHTYHGL